MRTTKIMMLLNVFLDLGVYSKRQREICAQGLLSPLPDCTFAWNMLFHRLPVLTVRLPNWLGSRRSQALRHSILLCRDCGWRPFDF